MTVQLQDAINAIQAGNRERGRQLLAMLLQREPKNEAAWIWMSGTVEDAEQRRYCLEQALAINPANSTARAGLALLKGQEPELPPPVPPLQRADHGLGQPPIPPDSAPRPTPAFVWEKEPEPGEETPIVEDTFIGDIVAAMNKDEDGTGKAPDTDLNWLFPAESAESGSTQGSEAELRQMFGGLEQDLEPAEPEPLPAVLEPLSAAPEPPPFASQADQAASEDEALGTFEPLLEQDYAGEVTIPGLATLPGQMWQDLSGRSRWVTILTDRHLIYAKPDPRRIPDIEAVLPAGQFPHRMLGRGAKTIPLERINRVRALSGQATLQVSYLRKDDTRLQTFTLSTPEQRDEVLEALPPRMGPDVQAVMHKTSLGDALFAPAVTLMVLVLITGLLYFGAVQLLTNPQSLSLQLPANWQAWLVSETALLLPLAIILAGGFLMALALVWLVLALRKPRRTIILERVTIPGE